MLGCGRKMEEVSAPHEYPAFSLFTASGTRENLNRTNKDKVRTLFGN
jgi:hypothetical protein